MEIDKEKIEKLILLLKEISEQKGNEWVKESILKIFDLNLKNLKASSELELLYKDLKRTKSFLKYVDGSNWREGFKFYNKTENNELKLSLSSDYKEMKIAESEKNILEYSRRIFLQIENIFNFLILKYDAFTIIRESEEGIFVVRDKNNLITNNLKQGKYSFFDENNEPLKISQISINSKILWIKIYFEMRSYSYDSWNNLVFLRNKSSHSSKLSTADLEKIQTLEMNFDETQRDLFKLLKKFYLTLYPKLNS